jgi:hypothetical protein
MDQYKQAAVITLEFLKRADIKGAEWRTFGGAVQFLEAVAQGQLVVSEPAKPAEQQTGAGEDKKQFGEPER